MPEDTPTAGETDPDHWEKRFDEIARLVQTNAKIAKKAAVDAAAKVVDEAVRAANEVKQDLRREMANDRQAVNGIKSKVDGIDLDVKQLLSNVSGLASAKLLQQGVTALILAVLLTIGFKAVGG